MFDSDTGAMTDRSARATVTEPEHRGEKLIGRAVASVHTYQRGRQEGLEDLAAQLRELAKDGVDEFSAGLRHAAREAERCAGGGQ